MVATTLGDRDRPRNARQGSGITCDVGTAVLFSSTNDYGCAASLRSKRHTGGIIGHSVSLSYTYTQDVCERMILDLAAILGTHGSDIDTYDESG